MSVYKTEPNQKLGMCIRYSQIKTLWEKFTAEGNHDPIQNKQNRGL